MNTTAIRTTLSLLATCLMLSVTVATPAFADDDSATKLKELERAMTAPGDGAAPVKKGRTRAIVFDNDSQSQSSAASEPAKAIQANAGSSSDCRSLPADVRANAVDFAIQFKVGSAELSPSSEGTLNEIAKILALSPDRCVLVEGHTDSTGNADRNMALSRDRANSVVRFIAEKGRVEQRRMVPIGKGSTDTIRDLDPRNSKSRRVVFKVVIG